MAHSPNVCVEPSVTVISPNGGESFLQGQQVPVSFSAGSGAALTGMTLKLSTDGGAVISGEFSLPPVT